MRLFSKKIEPSCICLYNPINKKSYEIITMPLYILTIKTKPYCIGTYNSINPKIVPEYTYATTNSTSDFGYNPLISFWDISKNPKWSNLAMYMKKIEKSCNCINKTIILKIEPCHEFTTASTISEFG